ncbi:MAG: permease of phosphate ABC transporter [bacterium]|nr:permease of phosphate ABC transporter [bacterium]
MKELFDYANDYIKKMDAKDITLLKFCLLALGILIGIGVPKKFRKAVILISLLVFMMTYIPVMADFIGGLVEHSGSKSIKIS